MPSHRRTSDQGLGFFWVGTFRSPWKAKIETPTTRAERKVYGGQNKKDFCSATEHTCVRGKGSENRAGAAHDLFQKVHDLAGQKLRAIGGEKFPSRQRARSACSPLNKFEKICW